MSFAQFNTYFVPKPVLDAAAILNDVITGNKALSQLPVSAVANLAARAALVYGATVALTKAFAVSKIAFGAVVLGTAALSAPTLAGAAGVHLLVYSVANATAGVAVKTLAIAAASWLVGVAVLRNYTRIDIPFVGTEVNDLFNVTAKGYIERMLFTAP
jgi:hypothetical protein